LLTDLNNDRSVISGASDAAAEPERRRTAAAVVLDAAHVPALPAAHAWWAQPLESPVQEHRQGLEPDLNAGHHK
jgi:hypothetical protein